MGPGLGPCQGSTSRGSCGLAWSSGFLLGHWAGGPLPSTGSSPAAPHCRWLGQVLAEVSWHRRLGLGSKAGIMPALDAIPAGGRALPGKRASWGRPCQREMRTTVTPSQKRSDRSCAQPKHFHSIDEETEAQRGPLPWVIQEGGAGIQAQMAVIPGASPPLRTPGQDQAVWPCPTLHQSLQPGPRPCPSSPTAHPEPGSSDQSRWRLSGLPLQPLHTRSEPLCQGTRPCSPWSFPCLARC